MTVVVHIVAAIFTIVIYGAEFCLDAYGGFLGVALGFWLMHAF
ncbi:MAG TPA: hypothetical protein VGP82_15615 [Ktedonobacterales bacterium]|nr:hypothetical protein [Ktedonobacterales bacterium]